MGFDWKSRKNLKREDAKEATLEAMKHAFRPEFINRLDGVIVFNSLNEGDCVKIARNQLAQVAGWLKNSGIELDFTASVPRRVAAVGFNPDFGARELRRIIQSQIEEPLSERILRGDFGPGDKVRVTVRNDRFDAIRVPRRRGGREGAEADATAAAPAGTLDTGLLPVTGDDSRHA
jgi:ATP-dependent Clp protease ATP-binding subunit ClpA